MEEAEKILTNLSKYELYKKFNEKYDYKNQYSSYCSNMNYLSIWYSDVLEVCYMFAKNLINLHKIMSEEKDSTERCRYFNFWITDYVRKMLKTKWQDNDHINSLLQGFYGVQHVIKSASQNYKCSFDYRSSVTLDLWKGWKDIHDYIRNYNDINERINSHGTYCKLYSNYFVYIKELQEKYVKECCQNPSDKCPNEMDLGYFCTTNILFKKLECSETKGIEAAALDKERDEDLDGQREIGRSPIPVTLPESDQDVIGDSFNNNSDYYAKIGVPLSFLGILSTFFYLYNFTTFGNWIRSKVLKKNIKINADVDAQNLMAQELNKDDENFYNDGYNITYHPS
ncbi:Plasmodium vivax Vir protein, putative [Plasmodium ovale]|uniref:Plasmodium vivax Vir protein, putative n=1 Tax=Plasmodium ovale TaxID=36330 RepID=A0A1C3KJP1_PLAOA|nr:Plasmodium vivax Vir protein, putative [Plasmodium ovale]